MNTIYDQNLKSEKLQSGSILLPSWRIYILKLHNIAKQSSRYELQFKLLAKGLCKTLVAKLFLAKEIKSILNKSQTTTILNTWREGVL